MRIAQLSSSRAGPRPARSLPGLPKLSFLQPQLGGDNHLFELQNRTDNRRVLVYRQTEDIDEKLTSRMLVVTLRCIASGRSQLRVDKLGKRVDGKRLRPQP